MIEIQKLSDEEFQKFSELIDEKAGIFLKKSKMTLLSNRLRKRLRETGIPTFAEYYNFIKGGKNQAEIALMINAVSTNETYFFRNIKHFDVLRDGIIPEMLKNKRTPISVFSAGSSTGEEAYTIAMIMDNDGLLSRLDGKIFAGDINSQVLADAKEGVFGFRKLRTTPEDYKQKYFKKMDDESFIIDRKIVDRVSFFQTNLLKDKLENKYDIIFCRNVMIYFNKESQNILVSKLYNALNHNGYLFIGHSESLYFLDSKFTHKKIMGIPVYYKE